MQVYHGRLPTDRVQTPPRQLLGTAVYVGRSSRDVELTGNLTVLAAPGGR